MKLWAISDLHLGHAVNRQALLDLPPHPDDWLIVAGDLGETARHFEFAWRALESRFARLLWTPGNHDLWTGPSDSGPRGLEKYQELVELCRRYGVLTPEDDYPWWTSELRVAPIFTLYDYSYHPPGIEDPLEWARQSGVVCADESYLYPDPYPSRAAWCRDRCRLTQERLETASAGAELVLAGHFPLRQELAVLPRIPRFSIWCGTRLTEDWHRRFRARVVVFGHLHIRSTRMIDDVRFEEVSLGNPNQWQPERGLQSYLRAIL